MEVGVYTERNSQFYFIMRKGKVLVCGVGIDDSSEKIKKNGKHITSYTIWRAMLQRCYRPNGKFPAYKGCYVSNEWLRFSAFKEWYDKHYIEGWNLDKDLLFEDNREYSAERCCFLPREINAFLSRKYKNNGGLPSGVSYHKRDCLYEARTKYKRKQIYLGRSKDDVKMLFGLYIDEKKREARELAEEYRGQLEPRAYEALLNYNIDIKEYDEN